jgi:hypothetical protein
MTGFEGDDGCGVGCGGGAVFLGDIFVLLLEVEHGGECGYMYGLGWNGIN